MDYLVFQMIWYVLVAFIFGMVVGWFAGGRGGART